MNVRPLTMQQAPKRAAVSRDAKAVAKALKLAESFDKVAADKFKSRLENTPKRQREGMSARIDGNRAQRAAECLRAAVDRGDVADFPLVKDKVLRMVSGRVDHVSYHAIVETEDWHDKTPLAERFRSGLGVASAKAAEAARLRDAEARLRNLDIPGFFPTPPDVIRRMMELARVEPTARVLEPSAGAGHLVEAVAALVRDPSQVVAVERSFALVEYMRAKGIPCEQGDFAEWQGEGFDLVVMNPPFEKRQDAEHIVRAFGMLAPGGRLVAVCSSGPFHASDKVSEAFREFMDEHGAHVEDLPADSFRGRDVIRETGVSCKLVVIDKDDDGADDVEPEPEPVEDAVTGDMFGDLAAPAPAAPVIDVRPPDGMPDTSLDRNETIRRIRAGLKKRSGKAWSVTGGTGTAWGWIKIDAPPARRTWARRLKANAPADWCCQPGEWWEDYDTGEPGGHSSPADLAELAALLGLRFVHHQGHSVPASSDYYTEIVDRAEGREPRCIGRPYWD